MSEGIVHETHFNSAFIRDRAASIRSNYSTLSPDYLSGEVKFPTYITTFRSGPSFDRSVLAGSPVSTGPPSERIVSALTGDNGHEFSLDKTELFQSNVTATELDSHYGYVPQTGKNSLWQTRFWNHPVVFDPEVFNFRSTDAELRKMGTDFIRFTNPLKPKADLLVSIAELLREGFPRMISRELLDPSKFRGRKLRLKALGGEYLNVVFGYKPIISDVIKVYDTLQKIDEIVEQWIRDDKKSILRHRSVSLPRKVVNLDEDGSGGQKIQTAFFPPRAGINEPYYRYEWTNNPSWYSSFSRRGQVVYEENITFSAQFSYDLSKLRLLSAFGDDGPLTESNAALREYLGLHAVGLAPTDFSWVTLWNLVPFSWLVDWFVNIGELFDNYRAEQSAQLQMGWAYVSTHATRKVHCTTYVKGVGDGMTIRQTVDARQKSIRRLKATPFGFDVSFDGLTANQSAILGALALSFSKL